MELKNGKFINMSDGKEDGFILLYMQKGKVKPVGLSREQMETLDLMLGVALSDKKVSVIDHNVNIKEGIIK